MECSKVLSSDVAQLNEYSETTQLTFMVCELYFDKNIIFKNQPTTLLEWLKSGTLTVSRDCEDMEQQKFHTLLMTTQNIKQL